VIEAFQRCKSGLLTLETMEVGFTTDCLLPQERPSYCLHSHLILLSSQDTQFWSLEPTVPTSESDDGMSRKLSRNGLAVFTPLGTIPKLRPPNTRYK